MFFSDFDLLCQEYELKTFDELKQIVKEDTAVIRPVLELTGQDAVDSFLMLVITACGASGKMGLEEYMLLQETTGILISYADANKMLEASKHKGAREIVDYFVDQYGELSIDVKAHMVSLCLAFCAANGDVNWKEKRFIKKLID
jgi:hypothetical protein